MPQILEAALDEFSRLFGNVGDVGFLPESLASEGRRLGRKRLGRKRLLAVDVRLGHGPLLDVPHRFARFAVEDVPEGLLRDLHNDVLPLAVVLASRENGLRRKVVVPKVVVDRLVVPLALARAGVERDDRVPEEIRAGAVRAVEVIRRRPG